MRWTATNIYIDGNYIAAYGNTGLSWEAYEENGNFLPTIHPLQIETGKEHILAVHIVEYVNPPDHKHLKTESFVNNLGSLVVLTGPLTYKKSTSSIWTNIGYDFLYSGVIGPLGAESTNSL